jgi:hypothetical protein
VEFSNPTIKREQIGFALGGLAGNNAHGAGFLEAALKNNLKPVAISCTSGQIHWVYEYLRARSGSDSEKNTLFYKIYKQVRQSNYFGQRDLDLWNMPWEGIPSMQFRLFSGQDCFDLSCRKKRMNINGV